MASCSQTTTQRDDQTIWKRFDSHCMVHLVNPGFWTLVVFPWSQPWSSDQWLLSLVCSTWLMNVTVSCSISILCEHASKLYIVFDTEYAICVCINHEDKSLCISQSCGLCMDDQRTWVGQIQIRRSIYPALKLVWSALKRHQILCIHSNTWSTICSSWSWSWRLCRLWHRLCRLWHSRAGHGFNAQTQMKSFARSINERYFNQIYI